MDQQVSISAWPRNERPRERLIERGAQTLSDAELLAVVLGTGIGGRNALDIARDLLQHFGGSLRRLLTSEAECLLALRGLGPARYATLMAALELARRHYCEALRAGPAMNAPAATRQFLTAQLRDRPYEVFCCLHLDNRHRLIHFEEVFRGTIDGASVHPREIVRQALQYNAAALIFAHNHPSGVAEASQADELITRRLRDLWLARHYLFYGELPVMCRLRAGRRKFRHLMTLNSSLREVLSADLAEPTIPTAHD
jgi:DNA repair protein RadC